MTFLIDGNFNVPGCVCTIDCEFPCWQRVGIADFRCCDACPPMENDADYVQPYDTNRDPGDEQDSA